MHSSIMQQQVSLLFAQNTLLTLDDHTDFFLMKNVTTLMRKEISLRPFLVVQNEFLSPFWFVTIETPF